MKLFNDKTDQPQLQRRQGLRRFRAWPFFPHGLLAALALAMAPFVLTWFVLPELGQLAPFAPAILAIVAASWFFGWKCSVLVVVCTLAGSYLMTPAQEEFKIHGAHEQAFPKKDVRYRKQLVAMDRDVDLSRHGRRISSNAG